MRAVYVYTITTGLTIILAVSGMPSPLVDGQIAATFAVPILGCIVYDIRGIHTAESRFQLQRAWSGLLWVLTIGVFDACVWYPDAARYTLAAAGVVAVATRRFLVPRAVQRIFSRSYNEARDRLFRTGHE